MEEIKAVTVKVAEELSKVLERVAKERGITVVEASVVVHNTYVSRANALKRYSLSHATKAKKPAAKKPVAVKAKPPVKHPAVQPAPKV